MDARLGSLQSELERGIKASHGSLLEMLPVQTYMTFVERYPKYAGFKYCSDEVEKYCASIVRNSDTDTLETYHKLLLVHFISEALNKINQLKLPEAVKNFYHKDFNRIVAQIEKSGERKGYYLYTNDRFYKDLAICCLRLFPVGARKYELTVFPVKRLIQKGWGQFVRMLFYLAFETRGVVPFLTGHYDTEDPNFQKEFNVEGFIFAYRMISEVMKMNPAIKGYFGINWLNDPQLERVSPRLAYIRHMNIAYGCNYFYMGANNASIKNATMKSETRRKLYQEGKYLPENYAFAFSRKQLINWADHRPWYW